MGVNVVGDARGGRSRDAPYPNAAEDRTRRRTDRALAFVLVLCAQI